MEELHEAPPIDKLVTSTSINLASSFPPISGVPPRQSQAGEKCDSLVPFGSIWYLDVPGGSLPHFGQVDVSEKSQLQDYETGLRQFAQVSFAGDVRSPRSVRSSVQHRRSTGVSAEAINHPQKVCPK